MLVPCERKSFDILALYKSDYYYYYYNITTATMTNFCLDGLLFFGVTSGWTWFPIRELLGIVGASFYRTDGLSCH